MELTKQIMSGQVDLIPLTEKQQGLLDSQTAKMANSTRIHLSVHMQTQMAKEVVKEITAEPSELGKTSILMNYRRFMKFAASGNEGVFSESEFRTLLSWAGHARSTTTQGFRRAFRRVVIDHDLGTKFLVQLCAAKAKKK